MDSSSSAIPHIVIVGAGFTGLLTARTLHARYGDKIRMTVVNATDHFVFSPRLIDALASTTETKQRFTAPLSACATTNNFTFLQGIASHIDRERRTVSVATQQDILLLSYDILILSQGGKVAQYNVPGCGEYASFLKTWDDVDRAHARVEDAFRAAEAADTEEDRRNALSFVIVGGGPSGIESAFALKEYVLKKIVLHERLVPYVSFTLLQGAPQILIGFPTKMVSGARSELTRNGIAVREGAAVVAIEPNAVRLTTGERIPSGLTLWAGGIEPNAIPINPDIDRGPGGMIADETLRIEDRIFAGGDAVIFRQQQATIPKTAQTAMQMAQCIASNVIATLEHQPLKPFRFQYYGSIVTLGKTGYINVGRLAIKFPFAIHLRDLFYRFRFRQIVG